MNNNKKNKMMTYTTQLLLLIIVCCSGSALAEQMKRLEENWYIGGSVGLGLLQPVTHAGTRIIDDKDLSTKIYAGVDISNQFGVEAFWSNLGESTIVSTADDTGTVKYSMLGVNGIYHLPTYIGRVHPFAKLGVAKINTKTKGSVIEKKDNDFSIFGGIGAEYDLSKGIKIRAEYEYFTEDISQISLGLNWSPNERMHYLDIKRKRIPAALPMNYSHPKQPVKIVKAIPSRSPSAPPIPYSRPHKQKRSVPKVQTISASLTGNSLFSSASARLLPNGVQRLNQLVSKVRKQAFKLYHITITGYTDSIGAPSHNLNLSTRRAEAVANYMVSKGVPRHQMSVLGMGESRPVSTNATAYGRSLNRRVDIKIKGAETYVVSN